MQYFWYYQTPESFDNIIIISDGSHLTGLTFDNKNSIRSTPSEFLPIFQETCQWLDTYFSGKSPNFIPKYKTGNITPFRKEVQDLLLKIPFGKTTTYGDLAKEIARAHHIKKMSARAVGGAVGWNPICIIIPCHRVLGTNNRITGYGCGIKNKIALLELEKITSKNHR